MATTKITSPDLFNLESLNTALKLPSGTTAERPTSPSTGEWRYNTTTNLVEFWDGGAWRDLQSENIPPINSENFNAVTYTGNGSTQSITGVGFKPDFVWIKPRSFADNHALSDSTRGVNKSLASNTNSAEQTTLGVTSFDADGFSLPNWGNVNQNGATFVAWCWKANAGTTSSNTDGSQSTTVQVNTKAGFSIVTGAMGSSGSSTFGHGLGVVPEVIIVKDLQNANAWMVYHASLGAGKEIRLNESNAATSSTTPWGNTTPTSTVYTGGNGYIANAGANYIAYCFAPVAGYSSFGTYTGTGATNGPIVNTGFEPAFVITKRTSTTGGWVMFSNKLSTTNPRVQYFQANVDNAEETLTYGLDFFSNGFQVNETDAEINGNGDTFIYIAFAADASAAPALPDSFANKLYTGNGGTQSITGLGFSPSLVWQKERGQAANHRWIDTVRGATNAISSSLTVAEFAESTGLTSFDADGFTVGSNVDYNNNGGTFVAWNWKANPVPTINTDGTIQSVVSANQAAGFSIVKWNGTGSAATVGHGLSAAPEIILTKRLNGTGDWYSFSVFANGGTTPANYFLKLNSSDSETLNTGSPPSVFAGTVPTATVFSVGPTLSGSTSDSYIAYCFTSIAGFSKMGTYTGTGATHAITGVGFQPDWIMGKEVDGVDSWEMVDSARGINKMVYANGSNAEVTNTNFTSFDSDGFTLSSATSINQSGQTYIYMAFKENPAQYAIPSGEMGYLVAAGGAGGGIGGGGAGGFRTTYGLTSGGGASAETNLTLATGTYTVTVGAGGTGVANGTSVKSGNGADSSIAATGITTITSVGGGGAGTGGAAGSFNDGADGGSGGGSHNNGTIGSGTANQGFAGSNAEQGGGAGGGAGSVGATPSDFSGGNGGSGITSAITGSNVGYAGGGAGNGYGVGSAGTATHGGGNGGFGFPSTGTSGTANTGGGAGGGSTTGSDGGSGIVVLRMNTSDFSGTTSGSPTISAIGSETILQYLASGSYVHNPSTAAGQMNYMVLAGGASGGSNGGGGGSGGLRSSWYASGGGAAGETPLTLSSGTYTITIGGGGAETTVYQNAGNNGTATTISGNATVNTVGGGGGGSNNNPPLTGGSGGGSGSGSGGGTQAAGTAGEGFAGGIGMASTHPYLGGGGGGTGAVGSPGNLGVPGAGGNGAIVSITGTAVSYGGGGGGTGGTGVGYTGPGGAGGTGGGGAGGAYNTTGIAATVNTGGGGGASGDNTGVGGAGGSGKVILRLITSEYSGTTTGSPTVTTTGTETVLTFTGSGTYVHS